jgi:hypothetical protein
MLDTIQWLAHMWYRVSETESVSVIRCKNGNNPIELGPYQSAKKRVRICFFLHNWGRKRIHFLKNYEYQIHLR